MLPNQFKIAMSNQLRLGPYDAPHISNEPVHEWLIVQSFGPSGEILSVSDATHEQEPIGDSAPVDLSPRNSIVALLAEDQNSELATRKYLIVRHTPRNFIPSGIFFPADGCVELTQSNGQIQLMAFGRHAHSSGEIEGQAINHDIPNPAPQAQRAINWHFYAEQRAWINQTPNSEI